MNKNVFNMSYVDNVTVIVVEKLFSISHFIKFKSRLHRDLST